MARYTKKDKKGRYYIESVNGKLESNVFGHTYGEAIERFAELENADVAPKSEVAKQVLLDLKIVVYNKAVYPNCQGDYAFINLKVLGGILQNLQKKYEVE